MFPQPFFAEIYRSIGVLCGIIIIIGSGCIHVTQSIELFKDSSAAIQLTYKLPRKYQEAFQETHRTLEKWQGLPVSSAAYVPNTFLSEERARTFFSTENVELLDYSKQTEGESLIVKIRYRTSDFRKTLTKNRFGGFEFSTDAQERTVTMTTDLAPPEMSAVDSASLAEDEIEELRSLLGDLRLTLRITTPGEIKETSGQLTARRKAEWQYSLQKDASFITSPADIRVTFKIAEDTDFGF